ncbi:hypothetical protein MLD38_027603 [Melastoma candidum]|uniref:Uncharacterized protein n=1 Tax=Melastoma candidum TaxID=119954 RepID=A0ACB9P3B6_9MYRT|nr:hypothetical protein MLD38_027603 [Melastoma candidum]
MDALRKQASKLKEQVAKQQQAVIKQFSGTGYESSDVVVIDEVELQRHQQLDKYYRSTRAGRDFQKDIVKIGYKHIKTGTKLSEDCCKYGAENIDDNILAKAAAVYGDARKHVEKEQDDYNKLLYSQIGILFLTMDMDCDVNNILEPLRAMITGAPLEDACHLAKRYSRMRQEAEVQGAEVSRRQARVRETPIPENVAKLHVAEARMQAATALAAVEAQQQRHTFQRLVAMVEGERTYHLRVAATLGEVEAEVVDSTE